MKFTKHRHLHRFDPDWQAAEKHGYASKIGLVDPRISFSNQEHICKCCGEHFIKQQANLWGHSKQLQFLGFGIPLFYQFLKYCIILLIINIGTYNALSLQQAVLSNRQFCHPTQSSKPTPHKSNITVQVAHKCYTFMIEMARIQEYYTQQQQAMRCISFVIHLLSLLYIRNMITKLEAYYDQITTTLSDFAVIIKGIDLPNGGVKKNTLTFISRQFKNPRPRPAEIIVCPQFQQIEHLRQKRSHQLNKIRPYYSINQLKADQTEKLKELQREVQDINQQIIRKANQRFDQIKNDQLPCLRVIIVFETDAEKQQVIRQFKRMSKETLKQYFGESIALRISQAPNAEQIEWQHFSVPQKKRILHILLGWGLSLVVLVIVFVVFYFSLVAKSDHLKQAAQERELHPNEEAARSAYNGYVALVFVLMFLVVLFGKIVLATLFHIFSEWQLHSTTAKLQFSFALKLSLGLFFTTALMTLAVQAIKQENYYTYPYGVVEEQTIMFFMNAVFIPFFWLVNPLRLFRNFRKWWYKGKKNLTQYEANMIMEEQPYNVGKRFAQVIETMWFVFLYGTLLPVGAIISVAGLSLYYWIDKYNLLRRSKMPGKVSASFMQTSLLLLDFTLILRPIGAIIFDTHLRGSAYQTSNIVLICVAFVFIILPKHYFIMIFNSEYFKPQQRTYSEVKQRFKHNYNTLHPLFCILNDRQVQQQKMIERLQSINSCNVLLSQTQLSANPPITSQNLLKPRS